MQPKRVISLGCSHAWGSEIAGRGITHHIKNYNLNFGKLFADKLGLPFSREGVPGGSNDLITHLAIEKIQPNDIVLVSWTYTQRHMFFNNDDYVEKESHNYTIYEISQLIKHEVDRKNILQRFFHKFNLNEKVLNHIENEINEKHGVPYFLKSITEVEEIIAKYHVFYEYSKQVQFMNFLRNYHTVNSIAKSRDACIINFNIDQPPNEAREWENFSNDYMPYAYWQYDEHQQNPINKDFTQLRIYNDWKNDPNRIVPNDPDYYSLKNLSLINTGYTDPFIWPEDRIGHLASDQHKWIANYLYNFYLDNSRQT